MLSNLQLAGRREGGSSWEVAQARTSKTTRREDIPMGERLEGGPTTQVTTLQMRLIEFKTKDNEEVRLLTSLLDPKKYPARKLAVGYHARWETEITYADRA